MPQHSPFRPARWQRASRPRVFALAGAALFLSGTALMHAKSLGAQATQPDTVARDTSTTNILPAVRVTVLRTPFDVTAAPLDVTSVPRRDAALARPGFALDEVLGQLAGVQVDNRFNFALGERIAIRGIGARSQFGVRGVRVIVDGIPATLADGQSALNNVDLGSIGSAEVIRGPVSSLYGNASGGVISLRTTPAPPQPFVPTLRFTGGSDGLVHAQVGAGGTDGRGTYVLNADRLDYRGYRAYSTARNAHLNGVGTWDWDRAAVTVVANAVQYSAENPGALSDSLLGVDRRQAYGYNVVQQTGERGKQNQLGASSHLQLGAGELRLSMYGLTRAIDNPIPPRIVVLHRRAGGGRAAYAVTGELGDATITGIVGGETDLQRDDRRNYINIHGVPGALVLDQRERVTSASPFAQLSATLGRATLLSGLRYDHFRFAAQDHLITPTNPDDSGIRLMSAISPSLGFNYALLPALSAYVNVGTGFQTPTTTELANRPTGAGGFNPLLQPERTHSHELGAKGRGGMFTYDAAVYDMRIDGELIPFEVPSTPGRQFYRNAGAARHRGGEADATVRITPELLAHASYGYTDARYVVYVASGVSYAGNRVPGIAPHIATASLQLGDAVNRFVAVEERAESATPVDDNNDACSPAYAVTNLRGQLRFGAAAIFGGLSNIFGANHNTSVTINAAGGRYFEPAPGRTVYAGVAVSAR